MLLSPAWIFRGTLFRFIYRCIHLIEPRPFHWTENYYFSSNIFDYSLDYAEKISGGMNLSRFKVIDIYTLNNRLQRPSFYSETGIFEDAIGFSVFEMLR